MVGCRGVSKTGWPVHVDCLLNMTMKKSIIHIQLMNWPVVTNGNTKNSPDSC